MFILDYQQSDPLFKQTKQQKTLNYVCRIHNFNCIPAGKSKIMFTVLLCNKYIYIYRNGPKAPEKTAEMTYK